MLPMLRSSLVRQLASFGLVGGVGMVIDLGIFNLLRATILSPEQMHTVRRWIVGLSNKPQEVIPAAGELPESTKPAVVNEKPAVESLAETEIPDQREPPIETKK